MIKLVATDIEEDIVFIAENGAQIRYKGKDISVTPMKREYAVSIIKQLREYNRTCDIVVSTPNGCLLVSSNKEFIDLITYGYHNNFTLVRDVLEKAMR